jgi:hypothetical protein
VASSTLLPLWPPPQKLNSTRSPVSGHVEGQTDKTELVKASYAVADHFRGDADSVSPGLDPATAARLLDAVAGLSERAGLSRKDEELKDTIHNQGAGSTATSDSKRKDGEEDEETDKKKADSKKRKDDDDEEEGEPTLKDVIKAVHSISKHMDRIEKKGRRADDDDEDEPDKEKARPLAADSLDEDERAALRERMRLERADSVEMGWKTQHRFHDWQAKCDSIAGMYGFDMHAPRPLQGEMLKNYKVRCLKPWQRLCKEYASVDLKTLALVDGAAFQVAADAILTAAREEAKHPKQVPMGVLLPRVEQRGGHTYTRWYGSPRSWMNAFAPPGKLVRRVNRMDSEGNITGSLYQRG